MKSIRVFSHSKYYYYRSYDKYEVIPSKKKKLFPTGVLVTAEDRKIFEYNRTHDKKDRKQYKGNPELRSIVEGFRHAIINRNFELASGGGKVKANLLLSQGLQEYISVRPNLKKATRYSYERSAQVLIDFAGDMQLHKYTPQVLNGFILHLRSLDEEKKPLYKETSISIITRSLRVLWLYFIKCKYVAENVIPFVKSPLVKPTPVSLRDQKIMFNELKTNHKPEHLHFINFLLLTGMRPGSAIEQRWEWVDFENKCMQVKNIKADRMFVFPLYKKLGRLLKQIGKKSSGKVFSFRAVDSLHFFADMVKKLTDPESTPNEKDRLSRHYSLYNLRDTFASKAANANTEMSVVKELLDHSDDRVTRRHYVVINIDYLRSKMDKIQ